LKTASADKAELSTDLQQHTWNRLIKDFIGAVRNDDKGSPERHQPPDPHRRPTTEEVHQCRPPIEQHRMFGDSERIKER
jgi:hypothetical protein